jgi:hypothetical protein
MKKYKKRDEVFVISPKAKLNSVNIIDLTTIDKDIQNKVWYVSEFTKGQLGYQYELTNIEDDSDTIAWVYEGQLISVQEAIEKNIISIE